MKHVCYEHNCVMLLRHALLRCAPRISCSVLSGASDGNAGAEGGNRGVAAARPVRAEYERGNDDTTKDDSCSLQQLLLLVLLLESWLTGIIAIFEMLVPMRRVCAFTCCSCSMSFCSAYRKASGGSVKNGHRLGTREPPHATRPPSSKVTDPAYGRVPSRCWLAT